MRPQIRQQSGSSPPFDTFQRRTERYLDAYPIHIKTSVTLSKRKNGRITMKNAGASDIKTADPTVRLRIRVADKDIYLVLNNTDIFPLIARGLIAYHREQHSWKVSAHRRWNLVDLEALCFAVLNSTTSPSDRGDDNIDVVLRTSRGTSIARLNEVFAKRKIGAAERSLIRGVLAQGQTYRGEARGKGIWSVCRPLSLESGILPTAAAFLPDVEPEEC